jgi:NADPH:quinone reductase-like Zn-dependent oxidoreductase
MVHIVLPRHVWIRERSCALIWHASTDHERVRSNNMSTSTTSMDHSPAGMTPAAAMHALRLHERGGPEQLVYEDAPIPVVGIGDVLLRVRALSFTPTELTWPSTWVDRRGQDRCPVIPAHEVSGVVMALGYGTTGMRVGDAVYGITDWYRDGAAAEYVAVEARNLAPIPSSLTHVQAAGMPMGGLTAWQALFVHGRLQAGQRVLIHGAGGGVGTVAVQLAHVAGAHVVATGHASSQRLVTELGAEVFINVDQDRFEEAVEAVDLVFDLVGDEVLHRSWSVVKPGGAIVSVVEDPGAPSDGEDGTRSVLFVVEPNRAELDELSRRIDAGELRPTVGQVLPLADGPDAFAAKQRHAVPGKIVLQVGDDQ